jgi:hypothetical protein
MKKWFSTAIFEFRWKKMTKGQHIKLVVSVGMMFLSAVLLCVGAWYPFSEDKESLQDMFLVFAFLAFVMSFPFTQDIDRIEGRISQKYLSEMNEIRANLGRKPWEDI